MEYPANVITIPKSIINEFNTNVHTGQTEEKRDSSAEKRHGILRCVHQDREKPAGLGGGSQEGSQGGDMVIMSSSHHQYQQQSQYHHHHNHHQKVFRRLEEERLGQLQAMAALYLQVNIVITIFIIVVIIIIILTITSTQRSELIIMEPELPGNQL